MPQNRNFSNDRDIYIIEIKNATDIMKNVIKFLTQILAAVVIAFGLVLLGYGERIKTKRDNLQTNWVKAQIELKQQERGNVEK